MEHIHFKTVDTPPPYILRATNRLLSCLGVEHTTLKLFDTPTVPAPGCKPSYDQGWLEYPQSWRRRRTYHTKNFRYTHRPCFGIKTVVRPRLVRISTVLAAGQLISSPTWFDGRPQVTGYDANTEQWLVEWLEGTTKEKSTQLRLPRLRIYLKAEDPFNFADRVADAHARRKVRNTQSSRGLTG